MADVGRDTFRIHLQHTPWNPAASTSYFFGGVIAPITVATYCKIVAPYAMKITEVDWFHWVIGTKATTETFTGSLRLNDTTDTAFNAVMQMDVSVEHFNGEIDVDLVAGDFWCIKIATPAWSTSPTNVYANVIVTGIRT